MEQYTSTERTVEDGEGPAATTAGQPPTPTALQHVISMKRGIDTMTTVLIADDEPNVRLLVTTLVASARYTVVEASDGEEALALLREHRPGLAILDVRMPLRTGLEVTRAVKADPALAGTYVILLTANAQATDVAAGKEAGADAYLTKPFSPLQLLAAVEQAVV